MIKYKNVTKWVYIKSYLTDAFEDTTSASSLQIQLNSIKMRNDEDVNDYCHRVEKLYYKLCTACTLNKEHELRYRGLDTR
ncbi:myb-like protein D [Aphis craccivora]|uniref:Myb-like protein D n=1 Tax=Aphis craccivora TaxID=307492 RepID=A0A6G0VZ65_APHCR|nr:myb-like protein D [Aphis craccivora]